jgi:hypothetical protein
MKNDVTGNDPALSRLLHQWQPPAELPPRFEERVWQHIARAEPPVAMSLWAAFNQWLDARLRRPALALACVAVLSGVGLAGGYLHGRADVSQSRQEAQTRYLQTVSPFLR